MRASSPLCRCGVCGPDGGVSSHRGSGYVRAQPLQPSRIYFGTHRDASRCLRQALPAPVEGSVKLYFTEGFFFLAPRISLASRAP